jgi:hypothetical protein
VHSAFQVLQPNSTPTQYPAFWGHDAESVATLQQSPNCYLSPKSKAAQRLWSQAGDILIAERMWLNTQRLVAVLMSQPVLSNVWWPFKLQAGTHFDR